MKKVTSRIFVDNCDEHGNTFTTIIDLNEVDCRKCIHYASNLYIELDDTPKNRLVAYKWFCGYEHADDGGTKTLHVCIDPVRISGLEFKDIEIEDEIVDTGI
jgi:hypothetical protein